MAFIEWSPRFATGVGEMDAHHQKLISLLNSLYDNVLHCETIEAERELTGRILAEVVAYTKYHFATEEKLMLEIEYPGYAEQKQAHEWFAQELDVLLEQYNDGIMGLSFDTFRFLKDWICNHISESDTQYRAFINKS